MPFRWGLWCLAAAAFMACGNGTVPQLGVAGLAAARARWEAHGPSAYTLTIRRTCECLPEATGPATLTVSQGGVPLRTYTESGEPVPAEYQDLFPDVPGLFRVIEDASDAGAAWLEVTYDSALGYPRRIVIDYDGVMGNDDELFYTMSGFQPH